MQIYEKKRDERESLDNEWHNIWDLDHMEEHQSYKQSDCETEEREMKI